MPVGLGVMSVLSTRYGLPTVAQCMPPLWLLWP
jgi:hypothetical protein